MISSTFLADDVITTLQKMKPDPFFSFAPVVDGRSLPRQPFTPDAPINYCKCADADWHQSQ